MIAIRTPRIMHIILDIESLCPSLDSKIIVVDICKSIPITIAIISLLYVFILSIKLLAKTPSGAIIAKINR
jgi:hypothetical protein